MPALTFARAYIFCQYYAFFFAFHQPNVPQFPCHLNLVRIKANYLPVLFTLCLFSGHPLSFPYSSSAASIPWRYKGRKKRFGRLVSAFQQKTPIDIGVLTHIYRGQLNYSSFFTLFVNPNDCLHNILFIIYAAVHGILDIIQIKNICYNTL